MFARRVIDARGEVSVSTSSLSIAVLGLDFEVNLRLTVNPSGF
jgi:hypothetical protein